MCNRRARSKALFQSVLIGLGHAWHTLDSPGKVLLVWSYCTTSGAGWQRALHKLLPPVRKGHVRRDLFGGAVRVSGPPFTKGRHVLKIGGRTAPAPGMERGSGEARLILRHLENLAVQGPTQLTGVLVKGRHDFVALHPQLTIAILLGGAGKIGAFRHDEAARFALGHLELLGNGGDGPVRSLPPDNHLCELGVYAVHQVPLVGPAAVPECLIIRRPGAGEDLFDGALIERLHGPAHAKAPLDLKGGAVVAARIDAPGGGVHKVKLIGI